MGLTKTSPGLQVVDSGLMIRKQLPQDKVVIIAGTAKAGKHAIFNHLTGINQQTGNWPGKTISHIQGYCHTTNHTYVMVDLPAADSLMAHSAEEEVARSFICFGASDATLIVCNATCLEQDLNLVLQTLEITRNVIVYINLMDEVRRKNIKINLESLSKKLGVPVMGTIGSKNKSLDYLMDALDQMIDHPADQDPLLIRYAKPIEDAIDLIEPAVKKAVGAKMNSRWLSLKLLDYDDSLINELNHSLGFLILEDEEVAESLALAKELLAEYGIYTKNIKNTIISGVARAAEAVCLDAVYFDQNTYRLRDKLIDRILSMVTRN